MPIFYWEMDGGGPFEAGGKKPNKKNRAPSTKMQKRYRDRESNPGPPACEAGDT